MNAVSEIVMEQEEFFAPANTDMVDGLIAQYRQAANNIEKLAGIIAGDLGDVIHYFIEGNCGDDKFHRSAYADRMFEKTGAVKALNAAFWSKALNLTDVLNLMPQKRREEWFESIRKMDTPEFEENTVRSTLQSLMAQRQQFFAERVDGIFRSLSHEHVTNCPQGFSKRMILLRALTYYGTVEHSTSGYINDLRCVIAKFMGRQEPVWCSTDKVISIALGRRGQWQDVDGGALRIRVYKKGTAHLEVHPDIAWRLNQVLAWMHPAAIPSEFRTKPKRKSKEWDLIRKPLPFGVLEILGNMKKVYDRTGDSFRPVSNLIENAWAFEHGDRSKEVYRQAQEVIESIGGVRATLGVAYHYFQFDYYAMDVIKEIVASGCIPDQKSHQYYPTPESIAQDAIELACIEAGHSCLEPSAGQGAIAGLMPKETTTCIEISALHCEILRAKGFSVHQADFIAWASGQTKFDRIVMNPPFSEGRAKLHVETAAELLSAGGRLVAVMPASFHGKTVVEGYKHQWSRVYSNEFSGTGVSVAIVTIER